MQAESPAFVQKARSSVLGVVTQRFGFEAKHLAYVISDNTGEKSLTIPYEFINTQAQETITYKNSRLRGRMLILYLCLSIFVFSSVHNLTHSPVDIPPVAISTLLGIAVIFYFTRGERKYTVLKTNAGPVRILHDHQHDAVLEQIKAHRIARLREIYGQIDFANAPEKEMRKFTWLKDNEVISTQEYEEAVKALRTGPAKEPGDENKFRLN